MRRWILLLLVPAVAILIGSFGEQESSESIGEAPAFVPTFYDGELLARYAALSDSGYRLLEDGKTEEAVVVFTAQHEMIPEGKSGAYNVACAYGRSGQVEEGLTWLGRAIDGGWDDAEHLEGDPDLASLREDPRFARLHEAAGRARDDRTATFAAGLPDVDAPHAFPDVDSVDSWAGKERNRLYQHRRVWHGWQYSTAWLRFEAQRLAGLLPLKADDPDYDPGLERIRALARVYSPYESWGRLSDGIAREVRAYLATDPTPDGRGTAHYQAAAARYLQKIPRAATDPDWPEMATEVREHLSAIPERSEMAVTAEAMRLALDLEEAGEARASVYPKVRALAERLGEDRDARQVVGLLFHEDFLRAVWPIPLDAVDLNGAPVDLAAYGGKVLLIDFWATWCGPCRAELPHLLEAHSKYGPRGFEILSISLDFGDRLSTDAYRAWIEENGMTWRHIYDQKGWEGPLVEAFLVNSIPAPLLIGRDGEILAVGEACRGEKLFESIEAAL